jgi:hypothetical protein
VQSRLQQSAIANLNACEELILLDGAGGGNRTHTPCGTGF